MDPLTHMRQISLVILILPLLFVHMSLPYTQLHALRIGKPCMRRKPFYVELSLLPQPFQSQRVVSNRDQGFPFAFA